MENAQQTANQEKVLENMGVLDLTGVKPEDLDNVTAICNIGVLIAPESLNKVLINIRQVNVGATIMVPETAGKVKIMSGQLIVGSELFENSAGKPEDILVIVGQVVSTSMITKCGFNEVMIAGQLIVPKGSEAALGSALSRMIGQILYYKNTDNVRYFIGEDTFSSEFFEFIEDKLSMVFIGDITFEDNVTIEAVKSKVSEIVLIGDISAPKALVPLLQYLTTTKLGEISPREND